MSICFFTAMILELPFADWAEWHTKILTAQSGAKIYRVIGNGLKGLSSQGHIQPFLKSFFHSNFCWDLYLTL